MKKLIVLLVAFSLLFGVQVLAGIYVGQTATLNSKAITEVQVSSKLRSPSVEFDRECVKVAINYRDEEIINALAKKNDIIYSALKRRHENIIAAQDLRTNAEITAAIAKAQQEFKDTRYKATVEYQKITRNAWLNFSAYRAKCKNATKAPGEPTAGGQYLDPSL
jgi:hypothetical protein